MAEKILVVDDESHILQILEARLQRNGYKVVTASDGKEALTKVGEASPDLIVLDVMMPPPDGFQVCRTLKQDPKYQHIPIILLTAKSTEEDESAGMEAGADAYICKPYNPEELLEEVRSLLE